MSDKNDSTEEIFVQIKSRVEDTESNRGISWLIVKIETKVSQMLSELKIQEQSLFPYSAPYPWYSAFVIFG